MNPFTEQITKKIIDCCELGASDVKISSQEDGGILFRTRVHGEYREIWKIPPAKTKSFTLSIYDALELNPAKADDSQDNRITIGKWDFRVAYAPNIYGMLICLRVIDTEKSFSLDNYSMPDDEKSIIKRNLSKKKGLILVTGPTGSGKSTLLFNALSYLNEPKRSILSIEQPVEYRLKGVDQIPIEEGKRLTFERALRVILRLDPDVILIGEIRDLETAKTAIHAANTGHLVLATLHTNTAMDAVNRLMDMGIEENILKSVLLYVSGQQLIPKQCEACRVPDLEGSAKLEPIIKEKLEAKITTGCDSCDKSGIIGKCLAFESVEWRNGSPTPSPTMIQRATEFARKGDISASELIAMLVD